MIVHYGNTTLKLESYRLKSMQVSAQYIVISPCDLSRIFWKCFDHVLNHCNFQLGWPQGLGCSWEFCGVKRHWRSMCGQVFQVCLSLQFLLSLCVPSKNVLLSRSERFDYFLSAETRVENYFLSS